MQLHGYRYYEPKTCGFDFTGALEDISVSTFLGWGPPSLSCADLLSPGWILVSNVKCLVCSGPGLLLLFGSVRQWEWYGISGKESPG